MAPSTHVALRPNEGMLVIPSPVPCSRQKAREISSIRAARAPDTPRTRVSCSRSVGDSPAWLLLLSLGSIHFSLCTQRAGTTFLDVLPAKDETRDNGAARNGVVSSHLRNCAMSSPPHAEALGCMRRPASQGRRLSRCACLLRTWHVIEDARVVCVPGTVECGPGVGVAAAEAPVPRCLRMFI